MSSHIQNKLKLAAEELLKAASTHGEWTSLAIGRETVLELQKVSKNSSDIGKHIVEELKKVSKTSTDTRREAMQELKKISKTSSDIGRETVQELKTVSKNLLSLKESLDSNINTLYQKLSTFESNVAHQSKNQRLEWAIENVKINTFKYSDETPNGYYGMIDSDGLVKKILFAFRKDLGECIPDCYYIPDSMKSNADDSGKVAFREALSNQMHELFGHKPRITLEADGQYKIYYS
jgi:hypothetical protein